MSKVYFSNVRSHGAKDNKIQKIKRLYQKVCSPSIEKGDLVAIKLHFGEYGNDTFISPILVRAVVDEVIAQGGIPFICDTNTLYSGKRHNSPEHIVTAIEHGFTYSVVRAPVIIADGVRSRNFREVEIGKKHFKKVKIAGDILDADAMITLSHFKGHMLAGFGGAIKNLSMGCSPAAGKKDQHGTKAKVKESKCAGCGECVRHCPEGAVSLIGDGKAVIKQDLCTGCGECMTVCPASAIYMDWRTDPGDFCERLAEYALGAVKDKAAKASYMNFLVNISPDCDCAGWSDVPIVHDIGFLASNDPVALDSASLDMVNDAPGNPASSLPGNIGKGTDKFKALREELRGEIQLQHGQTIGLGSRKYEIIEI